MKIIQGHEISRSIRKRCQVLVVGSGAGGGTSAAILSEAGADVIVLEEGGYYTSDQFDVSLRSMIPKLWRNAGMNPIFGKSIIPYTQGRCVGGGTVINGAIMWRTPEYILEKWAMEQKLPDLSIKLFETFFDRIEKDLHVSTRELNVKNNSASRLLAEGANRLGWKVLPVPRAQDHCVNANSCATGCPTQAKQSTMENYLPRALRAGGTLYSNCRADKIIFEGQRATMVSAKVENALKNRTYSLEIEADHFVIAGGPTQTPLLLRRSGIHKFVGSNFCIHPNLKVVAFFEEDIDAHNGTIMIAQVKEFQENGYTIASTNTSPAFIALGLAPHWKETKTLMEKWRKAAIYTAVIKAEGRGRVYPLPFGSEVVVTFHLTQKDLETIKSALANMARCLIEAGAKMIITPMPSVPIIKSQEDIEKFIKKPLTSPKEVNLITVHAMGSCRMGKDRDLHASVVDEFGKLHGTDNVYINDASILPGTTGVNPQETIMALTHRNLRHFCEQHHLLH